MDRLPESPVIALYGVPPGELLKENFHTLEIRQIDQFVDWIRVCAERAGLKEGIFGSRQFPMICLSRTSPHFSGFCAKYRISSATLPTGRLRNSTGKPASRSRAGTGSGGRVSRARAPGERTASKQRALTEGKSLRYSYLPVSLPCSDYLRSLSASNERTRSA